MLGAPGAVHPDPSQGADKRAPTVNGPHLSVRPKQGRRWLAGSRRRWASRQCGHHQQLTCDEANTVHQEKAQEESSG